MKSYAHPLAFMW